MTESLKWPDYLILVSFLGISLAIGLYHSLTGGGQKTTAEFFMANRQLKVLPTAISLLVSYQSAILILGMTAEVYFFGVQYLILSGFCFIINVIVVERFIVPWLYPLKLISLNEYVYLRYGSNVVRMVTFSLGVVALTLYMGMALYAPSAAFASVANFPLMLSIPLMAIVCVTYTALGGMRAVIWTDVFQFLIMLGGMIAIIVRGVMAVGGAGNVVHYAKEEGRLTFVDFNPDPTVRHTFWGILIGGAVALMPSYGISQAAVQRYSATKSLAQARMTIWLCVPGNVLLEIIAGITGIVVLAYYSKVQCDPLKNREIYNENQLLPHFVMDLFGDVPGFAGLFLATLYGGALSTVSSGLSSTAANFWEDVLKRKLGHLSETKQAIIQRLLVFAFGLVSTVVSFLAAFLPGPISQIALALCGSVVGPIFGIILLGGISKLGNWKGALVGASLGLALNLWISVGSMTVPDKYPILPPLSVDGCSQNSSFSSFSPLHVDGYSSTVSMDTASFTRAANEMNWTPKHQGLKRFYCLSYLWYVLLGSATTVVTGMVVSLITRDKEAEKSIDDRLIIKFRNISSCSSTSSEDEKQAINGTQNSQTNDVPTSREETQF